MTPTGARRTGVKPDTLVDTSAAVPLVVADHEHHCAVVDAVGDGVLGSTLAAPAALVAVGLLLHTLGIGRWRDQPWRFGPGVVSIALIAALSATAIANRLKFGPGDTTPPLDLRSAETLVVAALTGFVLLGWLSHSWR